MKIKAKEKQQPEIEFKAGDQIRVEYDNHSEYYLIVQTFNDKYALVGLATTSLNDWFDKGNLYVEGGATAETSDFVDSIDKLIQNLIYEDKAKRISKVNLTLVED